MTKQERSNKLRNLINSQEYLFYSINFGTIEEPVIVMGVCGELIAEGFISLLGVERYTILRVILNYMDNMGRSKISQTHIEKLTGLSRHHVTYAIKVFESYNIFTTSKVGCPSSKYQMNCYTFNKFKIVYPETVRHIESGVIEELEI